MLYRISIWLLRKAFQKSCLSASHTLFTRQIFLTLHQELQKEFTEDNYPTTNAFLQENMEFVLKDTLDTLDNTSIKYLYFS